MKKATALLLNWKRPENLKRVIQSIRAQSAPVEIFLWNNNIQDVTQYDVDLQINSTKNLMCWPRWFMANYANSEYVFSLDDDLLLADNTVISDCITYTEEHKSVIGCSGVVLNSAKKYWDSKHIHNPKRSSDIDVDIIKGKFMFLHTSNLKRLEMIPQYNRDKNSTRIEDDIILSSAMDKKTIPKFLRNRFKDLKSNDALYDQTDHEDSRQNAVQYYFGSNNQ